MSRLQRTVATIGSFALLLVAGAPWTAHAQSQADFERLLEAMKRMEARASALESRVATLEGENRQARRETAAARAEANALRQKTGGSAPAAASTPPPGIYAMATKAPPLAPVPSWSGLYAGAAFGIGWMRARSDQTLTDMQTIVSGAPPTTTVDTFSRTSTSGFGDRRPGALVDLSLGYNYLATPNVILGGQVEGGVSNIRVLNGPGMSTGTSTSVTTRSGVIQNSSTTTSVTSFATTDTIDNRWMVSVLGRGGVLVDPSDFVYGIGGYTYARMEAFNTTFGADGPTIGGGWERQLAPGWTLRGEYRYTKLQSGNVTLAQPLTIASQTNGIPDTSTTNPTTTSRVSADMHSVSLGVAHYFGQ